eukprot:TRINITY_DN25721_c0_g1_i1.p1 TRINITY_DN25721_c0_g1~~TRINITY_DN25721_c0_g1_i1.p1  ORF type:complete len:151 (+),score=38.35 TRINITY_DN25721_c0_g1_i1:86-538(+)
MGNASCCSGSDASIANEQKEMSVPHKPAPGVTDIPGPDAKVAEAPPPEPPRPPAQTKPAAAPKDDNTYTISLNKATGGRLGIDVDHSDGCTLLIEQINDGLVADWNANNEVKVTVMDRIVEVNGMRDDVLQLVDECKKDKVLELKIKRGS